MDVQIASEFSIESELRFDSTNSIDNPTHQQAEVQQKAEAQ